MKQSQVAVVIAVAMCVFGTIAQLQGKATVEVVKLDALGAFVMAWAAYLRIGEKH